MGSQKDPRLGIEDAVFGDRLRLTAVVSSGKIWFGNANMFLNCENLTSVPLSYKGYHNSIMGTYPIQPRGNLNRMFKGCKSFNQDLSHWLLLNCQDMKEMFAGTAMSPENIDRFLIRLNKVSTKNSGIFNGHKGLKRTGESEKAVKRLRLASWSIDFTLPQDDGYIESGDVPVVATFNPAKLELEPGKAGKAFTVSISPQDMPTTGIKLAIRPANPELKFESGKLVATAACKKGKYSMELDWGRPREVEIEGSMTVIVGKYAPTGVSFTPKSLEITQGQEKSFSYTLLPEGAEGEGVTLRIKDGAAGLTLDGSKLKVAADCAVGDYAVEVIVKDGTTVLGTLPVKVAKPAPKPTPKPEPLAVGSEQLASVLLSPNPATEQIRLSHAEQVAAWQLLSSNAQLEAQGRNQGASEITIPIRALAAGQYLLRLIGPNGDRTLLFIKE